MDILERAIQKYNHVSGKIHGSPSFCLPVHNDLILDFSSSCLGINLEKIASSFINSKDINAYPDPDSKELKRTLGEALSVSGENILITNGSSEAVFLLGLAFCANSSSLLLPEVTYSEYERVGKIFSSKIIKIPLTESDNFALSEKELEKALEKRPDIVFLCNPNNPTGHYMAESVLTLFKKHSDTLFVLDEAYVDFVQKPWNSLESLKFNNVLILRSFTKTHGLAGLRLGYLLGPTKIIRLLDNLKSPWNINYLAARLGNYLVKNPEIVQNEIELYIEGKDLLFDFFKENGLAFPTQTNYFLLKVKDSKMLFQKFLDNKVLVRECSSFGLNNFLRINAGKIDDCKRFLEIFKKIRGEISE